MSLTSDIPIVFFLGTGRCGSSLLQEVVARHPDVGFISNIDDRLHRAGFLGTRNQRIYGLVPPEATRKGRLRFAPSEGYRLLDRHVGPVMSRPVRDLRAEDVTPWHAQRLITFFESRYFAQGHPVFVHKLTGWPRARYLSAVFPQAKFVHVIRDGRAVANSLLQMDWWHGHRGPANWRLGALSPSDARAWDDSGQSFVVLAGLYWKTLMEAFATAEAELPPGTWSSVRYEDLVITPREVLKPLLAWVGLTPNPAFDARLAAQTFSSARFDAYREDLTPTQLRQLEDVLASTLERHGYLSSTDAHLVRQVGAG